MSPYEVLGVRPGASSEELHDAYRRLVKEHHPDRNGGSAESTRRFQEIQEAYEAIRSGRVSPPPRPAPPPRRDDTSVESRMADLERELRDARDAARDALRGTVRGRRPSDEELGYYTTDDSFTKILTDVREEVRDKLSHAGEHPAVKRVADLVDGLEDLASRFGDKR